MRALIAGFEASAVMLQPCFNGSVTEIACHGWVAVQVPSGRLVLCNRGQKSSVYVLLSCTFRDVDRIGSLCDASPHGAGRVLRV